jgi:hypothetical protein
VKRARLIMMLDDGMSWNASGEQLPCTPDYISRWKRRFEQERMAGLYARHRGSEPAEDAAKLEARVLARTQKAPSDGSTHGGADLGEARPEAPSVGALYGLRR